MPLPTYTLSKRAPSAARTPLLGVGLRCARCAGARSIDRLEVAERGGFEPPVPFRTRWFSKPVHSAALAPLHGPSAARAAWARTALQRSGPPSVPAAALRAARGAERVAWRF